MVKQLNFYMDDSGTRRPNRSPLAFNRSRDEFFALGGILIDEDDEQLAREKVESFKEKWGMDYPLHSVEIRNSTENFTWLRRGDIPYEKFMSELTALLIDLPVLGLACVVDRPGYDARYREKYARRQWHLCQTAFSIAIERATKEAIARDAKLNVYPERCSKKDDERLKRYWSELRNSGHPFSTDAAAAYSPLNSAQFAKTLYELKFKYKSSPMVQIADLFLWPLAKGGYNPNYLPYLKLAESGKIVGNNLHQAEQLHRGCKYSCFELVKAVP